MGVEIIRTSTASASFSFDAYGGDMLVLAAAGSGQASQISAVTFNGDSLTRQINEATTGAASSIWTLANPDQGNYTMTITGNPGKMRAILLRNAKSIRTTGDSNGSTGTISTSISPAISDLLIGAAGSDNTVTWTEGSGQTAIVGVDQTGISYKYAVATTDTMSWTISPADPWVQCTIAVEPKLRRGVIIM